MTAVASTLRSGRILIAPAVFLAFVATGNAGETGDQWTAQELAIISSLQLNQLPEMPDDPSNAQARNPAAVALGKRLFFDPRFSRNSAISCATCHDPNKQFQDGRKLAQGIGVASRRTVPIVAAGYSPWQFWDGRKDSLWSQALAPVEDPAEFGGNRSAVVRVMQREYGNEYESVFGKMPEFRGTAVDASPLGSAAEKAAWSSFDIDKREAISRVFANFGKAIAAYERTISHEESRFDLYVRELLKKSAAPNFTSQDVNGLRTFIGKGRCVTCHAGPLFTDHHFHSTRVPERDSQGPDPGRAAAVSRVQSDEFNCLGRFSDANPSQCQELRFMVTNDPALIQAFKTPSLRNVALRPPYMHAGQLATLREVIDHYVAAPEAALGPNGLVHRLGFNSELVPLHLTEQEIRDLISFLGTLSAGYREGINRTTNTNKH